MWSQKSMNISSSFYFFPFCCSAWVLPVLLSSRSLICPFISAYLLLTPSSFFFFLISITAFFNSYGFLVFSVSKLKAEFIHSSIQWVFLWPLLSTIYQAYCLSVSRGSFSVFLLFHFRHILLSLCLTFYICFYELDGTATLRPEGMALWRNVSCADCVSVHSE